MIDFSNMLGKPLRHCFVPADQASITFVFEDGMRRSFGAQNAGGTRVTPVGVSSPQPTEGVIFERVAPFADGTNFITREGGIFVSHPTGSTLVELPE